MQTLWQDLRYSLRMLRKRPGFILVAVITLALGIGANAAIFSLVNTVLLRPLPVAQPEQIVSLNNVADNRMFPTFSYPNYRDFRDRNEVFSGLIGYSFSPLSLSHDGINERLWGYVVTGNYFGVLGVNAALGRVITTDDDQLPGAHPVSVISYKCWQRRFGGDSNVIGKSVIVNGRSYTIIGVAPSGFDGTEVVATAEMWFPMTMQSQIIVGSNWLEARGSENLFVQGRLRPGVNLAQAQTAINAIGSQLEREFPGINEGKRVMLTSPGMTRGLMRGPVVGFTGVLMLMVGLVLLLACTNLANLLLARANERRREVAVRLALGASRWRLVRQLLTESLLLACAGGALGLLLALWLADLAVKLQPPVDLPLAIDLHIDQRVLLFTGLVTLATGVLFGLLPALQSTRTDLVATLKDEFAASGHRRSWLKNSLIVFQVALSLVLLVGGGLMLRSLQRAQMIDLGFDPHNAVALSFDLRLQGYDQARGKEFQKRLLERVRALPGVQSAGIADMIPVDLHFSRESIYIEGQAPARDATAPRALTSRISPGYFSAISTPLLEGREFSDQDDDKATPVVIVNETFARRFWPDEDPIGKRFATGSPDSPKVQIIGVARDGKYAGLQEDPKSFVYHAGSQSYSGATSLVIRADSDPRQALAAARREIQQLDAHLPISSAQTLDEHLSLPLLPVRLAASVLGSFGGLALALAAIGVYGVMAYTISKRTREIGIRMALGAQRGDILKLVISQGVWLTLTGVGIGLAASFAVTRLMKSLLFGTSATDPLTFAAVAALLTAVALLACYLPARRATRVDPMIALRYE
jgi:macrolide transport system ATP-binding/permease protein